MTSLVIGIAGIAFILGGGLYVLRLRLTPFREALQSVARSLGWTGIRPLRLGGGVQGAWEGRRSMLEYGPPMRQTDSTHTTRACLIVRVAAPGPRFTVTPRDPNDDIWTKPIVLTGPRLLDLSHLPAASAFWVRCDDPALAERIFRDEAATAALHAAIASGQISTDGHALLMQRPLPAGQQLDVDATTVIAREMASQARVIVAYWPYPPR